MKKYKDSFESRTESLEKGGEGIMTATRNQDPRENDAPARKIATTQQKRSSSISPIRTLADDLARNAKDENLTLSQQVLKNSATPHKNAPERGPETNQKTRTYRKKRKTEEAPRFSKSFLFLLVTLIIFGGSLYLFISRQGVTFGNFKVPLPAFVSSSKSQSNTGMNVSFPETLVDVNDKKELFIGRSTKRAELKEMLNEESRKAQRGTLTALFPTETTEIEDGTETYFADISSFFEVIDISTQSILSRNIDTYTLGVSGGGDARAFLVADVYSYEEVFGKLLEWERTMPRELYGFFHENLSFAIGERVPPFVDIIVSGHDARVLSGADEGDVLIYSLIDNKRLIITHSREELARIISRLQ
jgi:hypothetical protein